jgi:hypothetical protein
MANSGLGFLSFAGAAASFGMCFWQWRSQEPIDPIFRSFSPEILKRTLIWFTTTFYGIVGALLVYIGVRVFSGI